MSRFKFVPMLGLLTAALSFTLSFSAQAALAVGDTAPDFTLQEALDGKVSSFSLAEALKKGPVVVYFYPKSFTKGCTVEAHLFSEATPKFEALGASVVGISTDDIDTQKKFSVEECRGKFPVLADGDGAVTKAYDNELAVFPGHASRTSYVIAPDGKILMTLTDMKPEPHIDQTMKAVEAWKAAHP